DSNKIELPRKELDYKFNYLTNGLPQYYFDLIPKIGFMPVPGNILTYTRHYIPMPATITGFEGNTSPYSTIIDRYLVLESCLQSITLAGDNDWVSQKAKLYDKWNTEKLIEQTDIVNYYQPLKPLVNHW
ncbi:MAG: hypothetical protein AB1567_05935, partial [bacterium]